LKTEAGALPFETLLLDVTDAASIAAAAAEVQRLTNGRGLDVLVNNAGYGLSGPLEGLTDAALKAQFDTNDFGLLEVTRAFLPAMRARGEGRVLNVASRVGASLLPLSSM
jgi:NAD(P)-dependent dehydrogenase (short-subunit alcohol dehydrogenase family)